MADNRTDLKNVSQLGQFFHEYIDLRKNKENESLIIESIRNNVDLKGPGLWILIFAVLIASLGLNMNSTAVIIGAMLISPLMGPIMGIGLAIGLNDFELMKRSLKSYVLITIFSVLTATLYFAITPLNDVQSELLARTSPTIYDVLIALCGGLAGIIAYSSKEKGNVIPGVAIATALMPPLCTAGFGLATGNLLYFLGAFYLYFINSVFISLATIIGVRIMHFHHKHFVDKTREKIVSRYIIIITIATMIPAIYLTFGIVRNTVYTNSANKFIAQELTFDGSQVIDRKISYDHKSIRVVMVGREISDAELEYARKHLENYNLEGTTLDVLQGRNSSPTADIGHLKAQVLQDIYNGSEKRIEAQQARIKRLEKDLQLYTHNADMDRRFIPELRVLYPNVANVAMSKTVQMSVDSSHTDTFTLVLLTMKKEPTKAELSKLEQWLKARMDNQKIKLIVE